MVERIDTPDHALTEHLVLVKREQHAEVPAIEAIEQDGCRRMVSGDRPMWRVGGNVFRRCACQHGFTLAEAIGDQPAVLVGEVMAGVDHGNEVRAEGARSLVQQLMECMLAVGFLAAPDHGCRRHARLPTVVADRLAVALHLQLLQELRQDRQAVVVYQHRVSRSVQEVAVPDAEQRQHRREALGWR